MNTSTPCKSISDCTTPELCLSVGTCKGVHVLPASVRDGAACEARAGAVPSDKPAASSESSVSGGEASKTARPASHDVTTCPYFSMYLDLSEASGYPHEKDTMVSPEEYGAALLKDAMRYRWLRDKSEPGRANLAQASGGEDLQTALYAAAPRMRDLLQEALMPDLSKPLRDYEEWSTEVRNLLEDDLG